MNKKPLNILIVDDDRNFAHTLCAILRMEGYQCKEVHSVETAQEILLKEQFDCVFSDVKMPDKTGADLYYEIKDKLPNLPFILMTAYTSSEIIDQTLKSGVLAAIQKPIDIKSILEFLAKISRSIEGAIVCEEKEICDLIQKVFLNNRYSFKIYKSIKTLIKSGKTDYSIVLIDAHQHCEHYSSEIKDLLAILPKKTIVVICDYEKTLAGPQNLPQKINLIVLPRGLKSNEKINEILDREYFQHVKDSI
jgi:CheY-like chemotaxis protein